MFVSQQELRNRKFAQRIEYWRNETFK